MPQVRIQSALINQGFATLSQGSILSGWIWNLRLDPESEEGRGKALITYSGDRGESSKREDNSEKEDK
ncbi:hypothetical protein BDP27DRAFT_1312208 [Rhodocollybia butyracea]|uniref:Uncharacterized protein n=1 Tax=Rhodocollybia butyracea TaxID=206335 RepID=A0A9P5UGC8_9AGAR|nr:hypothetical protein BDP27DRAFT_1312208 [Rhodocollybia butyracea]